MKRHDLPPMLLATATLFVCRMEAASPGDSVSTTNTAAPATISPPAIDPGVRTGNSAGQPLPNLTSGQLAAFRISRKAFLESEGVPDGLGPRMNLDSCGGCHIQPALGGSSPQVNPQVAFATSAGASNSVPSFISLSGPVREARFVRNPDGSPDGGVHSLFTISGRSDAPSGSNCYLMQPDFDAALAAQNVIFRIPTPVFGAGLIEQIPDTAILANQTANVVTKQALGIRGRPNIILAGSAISGQPNFNGNDGTAARFGWKAQNKSLLLFSGEAYNVEMGITNELFQTERDETPECQFAATPNDTTDPDAATAADMFSDMQKFSAFMRFLAPPAPSPTFPGGADSIAKGSNLFSAVGCALCHTPTLTTGNSTVAALSNQPVHLYSDLLLHDMGKGLADGISQGQAGPSEFRTAPLWGLGQRIFFLHDGRTTDLLAAIQEHKSSGSEASAVVSSFNRLSEPDKQHLLNFLRSL